MEPKVESESVSGVGQAVATLSGVVNPEFQPVLTCEFVLSGGIALRRARRGPRNWVKGERVRYGREPRGPKPNTEYHYKVHQKRHRRSEVAGEPFLTLPDPPAVATEGASSITATSESIAGTVDPGASGHLAEDDTTYYVEYGGTTAYGKQTPFPAGEAVEVCRLLEVEGKVCSQGVAIVGEGTSSKAEAVSLGGLEPGRTYIAGRRDRTLTMPVNSMQYCRVFMAVRWRRRASTVGTRCSKRP